MDDEEAPRREEHRVSRAKLSKTPSWIMLGFVLGALFVAALPPLRKKTTVPPNEMPRRVEFTKPPPRQPQPLMTIEAVFAEWSRFAMWSDDDTTEVALWNGEFRDFTDCFEVRRSNGEYYFRTLPKLSRPLVAGLVLPPECPLRFTETAEQFRARVREPQSERPRRTQPDLAEQVETMKSERLPLAKKSAPMRIAPPPALEPVVTPRPDLSLPVETEKKSR